MTNFSCRLHRIYLLDIERPIIQLHTSIHFDDMMGCSTSNHKICSIIFFYFSALAKETQLANNTVEEQYVAPDNQLHDIHSYASATNNVQARYILDFLLL